MFVKKLKIKELLLKNGHFIDEVTADTYLLGGQVYCNGERIVNQNKKYPINSKIEILGQNTKYCSVNGYRLEDALKNLGLSVYGKVCIDAYADLGGYSEALYQLGSEHVYTLNGPEKNLCKRIYHNSKITVLEEMNMDNPYLLTLNPIPLFGISHFKNLAIKDTIPYFRSIMHGNGELICHINPINEIDDGLAKITGVLSDSIYQPLLNKLIDNINSYEGMAVQKICHCTYTYGTGRPEFYIHILFGRAVVPFVIPQESISEVIKLAIEHTHKAPKTGLEQTEIRAGTSQI